MTVAVESWTTEQRDIMLAALGLADTVTNAELTAAVDAAIAALVDSSPAALDTLNELAAALGDDPNFATTVTNALAGKLAIAANLSDLASAATARGNLGVNKRLLPLSITGTALTASEVLTTFMPPTGETWTFPANLSTSSGKKLAGGTNPAASYAIDLVKNGSSVATITISTGGVPSFATSGGTAFTLTGGSDDLQVVGPAVADTALGYVFTLVCTY